MYDEIEANHTCGVEVVAAKSSLHYDAARRPCVTTPRVDSRCLVLFHMSVQIWQQCHTLFAVKSMLQFDAARRACVTTPPVDIVFRLLVVLCFDSIGSL